MFPENPEEANVSAFGWWEPRRLRYNIGLVVAGILAFILYIIVLSIFHDRIPDAEITLFTINLLRDKASAAKFEQRSHRICPSTANSAVSQNCFSPSLG